MSTSRFVHVVEDAVPDRRALIAQSPSMQQLLLRLPRLAEAGGAVLRRGERGTGKERIARALHRLGPGAGGPFVVVAAAPPAAGRAPAPPPPILSARALALLVDHPWPGNVRELESLARLLAVAVERRHILAVYEHTGRNKRRAADLLGISLRTLYDKLTEYRMHGATAPAAPAVSTNGAGALSR